MSIAAELARPRARPRTASPDPTLTLWLRLDPPHVERLIAIARSNSETHDAAAKRLLTEALGRTSR